jgi:hypothetical protein
MPHRRVSSRLRRGAVVSALLPALVALSGCSILIDVDHCKNDDACGPGKACHAGRCETLMPIDASVDSGVTPDAAGGDVGNPAPSICESSDLPGLLATYTFGDAQIARRREQGLDRGALADFDFGFVPATPFSAVWDARFRVENPLREQFVVDTNGRASLRIDNEVIWEGTGTGTVEADLRPGAHTLSLQVDELGEAARVRLKEGPVGTTLRVVGGPGFRATADCDDERGACQPVDDAALFEVEDNVFHCGACGRACTNHGGATACERGVCRPACTPPAEDADGDPANGCEARVLRGPQCGDVPAEGFIDGEVRVEDVTVCPYERGRSDTGRLTVRATSIRVVGRIDARGAGFGGGGGGGGAGGTVRCGDTACPAEFTPIAGGRGGRAGAGGSQGRGGEAGRTSTCFDAPVVMGDGGRGGDGGGMAWGTGGRGGSLRVGTNAAFGADDGGDGGYLASGANGDESTDLSVVPGSGGGGGGGAGGLALDGCCTAAGGGGGGAGSPGGGAVVLEAREAIVVERRGEIITAGGRSLADNGQAAMEAGGDGGDADAEGAGVGGPSARADMTCNADPGLQAPPAGGRGGGGGGGGVLLMAPTLTLVGAIDARGSASERNGGTVKLATCGEAPAVDKIHAGRVVEDLRLPDCP